MIVLQSLQNNDMQSIENVVLILYSFNFGNFYIHVGNSNCLDIILFSKYALFKSFHNNLIFDS